MIRICVYFINWLQKFGELSPKKSWGPKTCKISVDFIQPPTLIANISGMAQDIQKRKPNFSRLKNFSSCVLRKRSGERWSTNYRDLIVSLDPLKCTYLVYNISALRGCFALKFLHALEIEEGLLAHTPRGTGVPPKNFNREILKSGLKFSVWANRTSGLMGVSSQNFFHSTCRKVGVIKWV